MKRNVESLEAVIWMMVAAAVVVCMLYNSISAMLGTARFAYWHVPTAFFLVSAAWSAVPERSKIRWRAFTRLMLRKMKEMRMKAAKSFSDTQREARGLLASLFNNNNIQTEP